ncbi:MAG: SDR family NAD(P)-dependent oxidoreductase [Spirochaetes bacterium]|nr:SDR family NAD(P)-dependent oxidoreductase [Spirochaetota bacterium]
MKKIMITGTTSGLGLEIASQLAQNPDTQVIMAVRNLNRGLEIARQLGKNVSAVHLDLSSLGNVGAFVRKWRSKLDGLVNNAGVQFSTRESFTADSLEETIAVNHLAVFLLTIGLEKHLSGGKVLFMGSGTHNPKHKTAAMFGFRGARYTSVQDLASGGSSTGSITRRNMDRYATSKFLVTVTAVELARRDKTYQAFVLDPGLMPGTGLARTQSPIMRFMWSNVLPIAGTFLPDTSSTKKSASAAAWIMTEASLPYPSGTIFSYDKKPCRHVWEEMVRNPKIGADVYEQSLRIVERFRK